MSPGARPAHPTRRPTRWWMLQWRCLCRIRRSSLEQRWWRWLRWLRWLWSPSPSLPLMLLSRSLLSLAGEGRRLGRADTVVPRGKRRPGPPWVSAAPTTVGRSRRTRPTSPHSPRPAGGTRHPRADTRAQEGTARRPRSAQSSGTTRGGSRNGTGPRSHRSRCHTTRRGGRTGDRGGMWWCSGQTPTSGRPCSRSRRTRVPTANGLDGVATQPTCPQRGHNPKIRPSRGSCGHRRRRLAQMPGSPSRSDAASTASRDSSFPREVMHPLP